MVFLYVLIGLVGAKALVFTVLDSPLREPVRIDSVRGQSPNSSIVPPVARSRIM